MARRALLCRLTLLVVGLGFVIPLAACGRCGPERGLRHSVRFPMPSDPSDLSFARARDAWSLALTELIGDTLVSYDAKMRVLPRIASSWEWSDDHLSLVFHLRDDAFWHDGVPVTSADVVRTVEVFKDLKLGTSTRAAGFSKILRAETIDPHTVRVIYSLPSASALAGWTAPLIPAHRPLDDPQLVGCGPWIFERWETGERIVLRANKTHFADPPHLDELDFEVLGDPATRFAALKTGRIDASGLLSSQYKQIQADETLKKRWRYSEYRILYFWYLAWRMDAQDSLFAEASVRRAMTQAIDRQGFLDRFGFDAEVASSSFHPDSPAFDKSIQAWSYDPDEARRLLREAGWIDRDGNGVLDRDGRPFRFRLIFSRTSGETEKIATVVQSDLREVGVVMELEPLEWAVFLDRARGHDYDALMSGWRLDPDPDPFDLWHSSQAEAPGANYAGLRDAQIDEWIEQAQQTFDDDARRQIYYRIQQRLHQLQPDTFFFYPRSRLAIDRRLQGMKGTPLGPLRFVPGPAAWKWSTEPLGEDETR